jgi:hypothetical protein
LHLRASQNCDKKFAPFLPFFMIPQRLLFIDVLILALRPESGPPLPDESMPESPNPQNTVLQYVDIVFISKRRAFSCICAADQDEGFWNFALLVVLPCASFHLPFNTSNWVVFFSSKFKDRAAPILVLPFFFFFFFGIPQPRAMQIWREKASVCQWQALVGEANWTMVQYLARETQERTAAHSHRSTARN